MATLLMYLYVNLLLHIIFDSMHLSSSFNSAIGKNFFFYVKWSLWNNFFMLNRVCGTSSSFYD
jgi:hypothetical protein